MTNGQVERKWLERRCVKIWRENCYEPGNFLGTGCLISPRHVLTAAHVVNESQDRILLVSGRAWASERTVRETPVFHKAEGSRNLKRDVAVLVLSEADQTDEEPLPLADSDFLRATQGQEVTIGGFAQASGEDLKTVETGIENYDDKTDSIIATGPVERGMSGGPVVRDGKLVGIAYATSGKKHKTYVIPLTAVRDFLQTFVAPPVPAPQQQEAAARLKLSDAKKWARYVDRTYQVGDLAQFLGLESSASSQSRGSESSTDYQTGTPIVALLTSTSQDRHRYLRHRFEEGEKDFDPHSVYAQILTGIQFHDIPFCADEPKEDIGVVLGRMKERLRSSLSAASTDPGDVNEALNHKRAPQGVFSTIAGKTGTIGPKREDLLKQWIRYWAEIAGGADQKTSKLNDPVIIIISVVTDAEGIDESTRHRRSSLMDLFRRRGTDRPLPDWCAEWPPSTPETPAIRCVKFAELGRVLPSEVEAWIKKLREQRPELAAAADAALTDVSAVIPVDGVTMAEFVDECLTRLSIVEQG